MIETNLTTLLNYFNESTYTIKEKYSLFREQDNIFVQKIPLPGVSKEQIGIKIKDNTFTITLKESTEYYDKNYSLTYYLPKYGKFKELKATMENGLLTITVPKENNDIEIKVE